MPVPDPLWGKGIPSFFHYHGFPSPTYCVFAGLLLGDRWTSVDSCFWASPQALTHTLFILVICRLSSLSLGSCSPRTDTSASVKLPTHTVFLSLRTLRACVYRMHTLNATTNAVCVYAYVCVAQCSCAQCVFVCVHIPLCCVGVGRTSLLPPQLRSHPMHILDLSLFLHSLLQIVC